MNRVIRLSAAFVMVALIAACNTTVRNHGHRFDAEDIARIRPGITSEGEVAAILGTPSARGSFDERTWYYVTRRVEQETFYSSELTNQDVVKVRFDDIGVVDTIETYSMEDGRQVAFNEDATPTGGNELGIVEQLIGNIGRFNPPSNTGAGR